MEYEIFGSAESDILFYDVCINQLILDPKVFKKGHSVILYLCTPSLHTSVHFPTELTCVVCPKTPIHSTYVYSTRVLLYILTQLLAPNSHNWVFVPKKTIIQKLSSNLYSELFKCLATVSRVF